MEKEYFNEKYQTFKQQYNSLIGHETTQNMGEDLAQLLDSILDFTDNSEILSLFNDICEHYQTLYPDIVSEAIMMYHYIWDDTDGGADFDDFSDLF